MILSPPKELRKSLNPPLPQVYDSSTSYYRDQFRVCSGMDKQNLLKGADTGAKKKHNENPSGAVFVVSDRPLVPSELQESSLDRFRDYENLGELPRSYGRPVLFGIARDSHTLFLYWEIDWRKAFGDKPPLDQKVYLRVTSEDGGEETKVTVEPLVGNQCVAVSQARSMYQVELGYYDLTGGWNSVAISEPIATPPDHVSEQGDINVATVPFHLSFQRMIDNFRGSKYDGAALVEILARLQKRADDLDETLTETERELLQTIECTLSENEAIQRARLRQSKEPFASREGIEAILGFGPSSR